MSNLSNQQMKAHFEQFVERIATGTTLDGEWRRQLLDMSMPELPEAPTPEQLSAWDELSILLSDPSFERQVSEGTKAFWTNALDPAAYKVVATRAYEDATKGADAGLSPQSAEAQTIARDWLEGSARALGRKPDRAFREWHFAQYERNAGRLGRYRELVTILRGDTPLAANRKVWGWLNDAMRSLQIPN